MKRLSDSATQRLSDSATQRLSDSATQRLSDSATQRLSDSATQRLNDSATQRKPRKGAIVAWAGAILVTIGVSGIAWSILVPEPDIPKKPADRLVDPIVDLGTIEADSMQHTVLHLENSWPVPVTIRRFEPMCGCTVLKQSNEFDLACGESHDIELELHAPARNGEFKTHVIIHYAMIDREMMEIVELQAQLAGSQ